MPVRDWAFCRRGSHKKRTNMSSDAENEKSHQSEDSEMKAENDSMEDSKNNSTEVKTDEESEVKETEGSESEEKPVNNKAKEKEKVEKEDKKDKKNESNSEEDTEGTEKDDDKDDDDEEEEKDEKPKKTPPKDRKKVVKNNDVDEDKDGKIEIPKGKGTQLGEIARIDASISRFKNDDLKLLHKLLFKSVGKTTMIKKNIRKFNGFNLTKDSDEYNKKLDSFDNFEVKQLKIICEMLDLEKKGSHEEMSERILDFLIEPKDSGKIERGGRPRRTAAVRANNRGYSSHDDSYSEDEKAAARGRRNAGKRSNLKDETSSESDEEFKLSDNSEDEKPVKKRKRGPGRRKKDESEEDASDDETNSSEDSDGAAKKKKKMPVANNKGKVGRPRGRGRPAGTTKKESTPGKRGRKPATSSGDEAGDNNEEEGSSSEDEPLAKKTNKNAQPPTDDEIKAYVKEILDGANLEEITMKTVCKQVYAHYPDFDLTHKKAYIKTTVKSVIE